MIHGIECKEIFTPVKEATENVSLGIKRDEETVTTKIDSNPRSRASVYEPISLQSETDYFLSSPFATSKNGTEKEAFEDFNVKTESFDLDKEPSPKQEIDHDEKIQHGYSND